MNRIDECPPCNRCVTEYTLRGRSKHQASRDGDMMASSFHDPTDCIRHLAAVVGVLFQSKEAARASAD